MTREEAIIIIKRWLISGVDGLTKDRLGYMEGWFRKKDAEAFKMAIQALEQKTGRWIKVQGRPHHARCDTCDTVTAYAWGMRYCPNCGCRMVKGKGDKDE